MRFQNDFPASFIVLVTRQSTDFTIVHRDIYICHTLVYSCTLRRIIYEQYPFMTISTQKK